MIDYKWKSGLVKTDADSNKKRCFVSKVFLSVLARYGFVEVDLPSLDYADAYIINNELFTAQNHFKSIAPNGEVLSLGDDVVKGLISFSFTDMEGKGKLCAKKDAYSFIDGFEGKSYEYQTGGVVFGTNGLEDEADILLCALDTVKALQMKEYKLVVGNTDIFMGVLGTFAGAETSLTRLRAILKGEMRSDFDYATAQTLSSIRNTEGSSVVIKELAQKLDNKTSIDGLVNLFEVMNILEAYEATENVIISPGYVGVEKYDKGIVFEIRSASGKTIAYGGRCDCKKGQDDFHGIYIKLNAENALEEAVKNGLLKENEGKKVLIAVAETRAAITKANKVRRDLMNENFICDIIYNATEETLYDKMSKYQDRMVIYVDGEGNIVHS